MANVPITTDETGKAVAARPIRIVAGLTAANEAGRYVDVVPIRIVEGMVATDAAGRTVPSVPVEILETGVTTDETGSPIAVMPAREVAGLSTTDAAGRVVDVIPVRVIGGAAPGLAPYLGQVATRCFTAMQVTGSTAQIMSRSAHIATQALTSLQIILPGFYASVGNDDLIPGTVTYHASIEYPAATFTEVLWSAATTKAVTATAIHSGLSDAVSVTIPSGAVFWVRIWATAAANTIPVTEYTNSVRWAAQGEASILTASGGTDATLSGTITDGGTGRIIYPLAIVATTTKASFYLIGDSRTAGASGDIDANGNLGQLAESMGATNPYMNMARGSAQLQNFNTLGTYRRLMAQYCSHVINGYGINDLRTGGGERTSAQLQGDFEIFAKIFPTKTLICCTIAPNSSGVFTSAAGQTADPLDAQRLAFNTWARTVPSPYAACVDLALVLEDQANPGKWVSSPQFTGDGVHGNATAYTAVVAAGVLNPTTLGALTPIPQFSLLSLADKVAWGDVSNPAIATSTFFKHAGGPYSYTLSGSPVYSATSFAGGPGYTFDGSTNNLVGDATYYKPFTNGLPGFTIAALFQLTSNPASTKGIFGHCIGGANTERGMIMVDSTGHLGLHIKRLDAHSLLTVFDPSAIATGTPTLVVAVYDPTNNVATLYVNGVSVASRAFTNSGSFDATNSNNVVFSTLAAARAATVLGEANSFSAALDTTARQKLEGAMAWKRGLAASVLPGGHPYLSAAPTS